MPTPKRSRSTVPLKEVIVGFAEKRNMSDTTKAGKILRSSLRSNFSHLSDRYNYPEGKENRDGNRWPDLPADLAQEIITTGKVPSGK